MKAYLIPGAFEGLNDHGYKDVLDVYKAASLEPRFIKIEWKYKTIDDWIAQVKDQIPKRELQNSLLSGFSWGAMIALTIAAEYTNPKTLFLFSLSPYFAEDLPTVKKPWMKWAGKKRVATFKNLQMNKLAAEIKCPTTIFIGSQEISKYSDMKLRTNEAHKRIKGSELVVIDGVKHDIADPRYVGAIKQELST